MKIQNKKTKNMLTVYLSASMIGLLMIYPIVMPQQVNAFTDRHPRTTLIPPPPPTKVGCYHYANKTTGWQPSPCMSASEVKKLGLATEGDPSDPILGGQETNANTLINSYVDVSVAGCGNPCETDSLQGKDSYSIQDNTNTFQDQNLLTAWDQFVFQQIAPNNVAGVCVEQWENGQAKYDHCMPVTPMQQLGSNYGGTVYGSTSSGTMTAMFCTNQCWSDTETDEFGLEGNWNQVTGTILGESSTQTQTGIAEFTSPTTEYTTVEAAAPSTFSYVLGQSTQSQEENNLTYVPTYTSTSCDGFGDCYTYTESTN